MAVFRRLFTARHAPGAWFHALVRRVAGGARPSADVTPEVWCRPATILVLRDRDRATACLAGWR